MHRVVAPPILYWGTPVVLVSTLSAGDRPNIGPMSSAFCLTTAVRATCPRGAAARRGAASHRPVSPASAGTRSCQPG